MNTQLTALPDSIGRYHIVRVLGQGAMGRVLLAHDPVLDRDVAVKLLRNDLGIPSEHRQALLDRMRQEARASARVSHPNIVALHDMGDDLELGLYLVFEYVEGITLKERLTRGPLGPEAAARIAREVGGALTTAHATGVLHRDIKPENVILSKTGAKIADFGIARVPDSTLTRDGGLLGTPAYSAPEAIASSNFSPLSDQFSMAATLYEAISLRRAFPGEDAVAVATRIATEEPPRIAEVCGLDPHVDTILARALSKNARSRFESCEAFGNALAEALVIAPRAALPTLPDQRHQTATLLEEGTGSRSTRIAIGAAAAGALLAAAVMGLVARLADSSPAAAATDGGPLTYDGGFGDSPGDRLSERKPRRASGAGSTEEAPAKRGSAPRDAAPEDSERQDAGSAAPPASEPARDASVRPAPSSDPGSPR